MIDHIIGRPNPSWKRTQVFLVIFFWVWQILHGSSGGPRLLWLRRVNRFLQRFTPWQIIVSTLTAVYALRNLDKILGLGSPEPLANLYSPSYYRATWIAIGLDAGFATAMTIRPKWLRDLCSILFSVYYIIYANEADEKLRRFRAVPTVEMMRTTWEKTTNPYVRAFTRVPPMSIRKKIHLPRPADSTCKRPITAWLFFAPPAHQLKRATDLILDIPGGGFIAMSPEHHEERLRMWAARSGKPVLAIEYGKAPEYPFPFAIDECFDAYRILTDSLGIPIGMSGKKLNIIMSGDSAGASIAVGLMIKILETQSTMKLPTPMAMVLSYACLDFNFTSWMSPQNLRVLRSEHSTHSVPGLADQKDHFAHVSPLSMVRDERQLKRKKSWREAMKDFGGMTGAPAKPKLRRQRTVSSTSTSRFGDVRRAADQMDGGETADEEDGREDESSKSQPPSDRPVGARVRVPAGHRAQKPSITLDANQLADQQGILSKAVAKADENALRKDPHAPIGTRITMTSRTGYFQDRIISPSMMRAMAILYIGPYRNPDFATDYHVSPILTPSHLLARFPPLLMQCGEKDPFVDDTIIFAGRVRESKRQRKRELDLALAGKSAKFGEGLRMSQATYGGEHDKRELERERDRLAEESEEDWVQMVIFEEWSHGYLQMPTLMSEAKTVIEDIADWMDDMFASAASPDSSSASGSENLEVPGKGALQRGYGGSRGPDIVGGSGAGARGGRSFTSETEMETDDAITIVTRNKGKRRSPPPPSLSSFGGINEKGSGASSAETLRGSDSSSSSGASTVATSVPDDHDQEHSTTAVSGSREPVTAAVVSNAGGLQPTVPVGVADPGVHGEGSTPDKSGDSDGGHPGPDALSGIKARRASNRVSVTGSATPTISETEVMRRRRLLDSHICTGNLV